MNVFELMASLGLDSSEYDAGLTEGEGKAETFGGRIKSILSGAAKAGVAAMAAIGAASVAMGTALIKETNKVAEYGDHIDKMSQKMGMTAQAYQEWDAVMRHSGTSIESMQASMKTLASAAETGSDAFTKLGMSQQEIANMSQEELFEKTITALQNVEDETERTYLAGKLLGRGATELGPLLNTSAEETQAMRDRVHELGGVMSDEAVKAAAKYQDSLQDMQTAISGASRGIVSEFLPAVTSIMDGIAEIFGGDGEKGITLITDGVDALFEKIDEAIPKIAELGGKVLTAFSTAILNNLPKIMSKGTDIVLMLVTSAIEAVPAVAVVAYEVVEAFVKAVISNAPKVGKAGLDLISQFESFIRGDAPKLIITAAQMIQDFVTGMLTEIPNVIGTASGIMTSMIDAITSALPDIMTSGGDIILSLLDGIIESLPNITHAAFEAILSMTSALYENLPSIFDAGAELIGNLLMGIVERLPEIAETAVTIINDFMTQIEENLPTIIQTGITIIGNLARGIVQNLPAFISAAVTAIGRFISTITANLPQILSRGISIVNTLSRGILSLAGLLLSAAIQLMGRFVSGIAGKLGDVLNKGREIVNKIASGVLGNIGRFLSTVPTLFSRFVSSFRGKNWGSIGTNIITGIANGIRNAAGKIVEAAKSAAKRALDAAKSFLGIKSPSRIFRDQVGKMMAEGMAIGFDEGFDENDYIEPVDALLSDIEDIPTTTVETDGEGGEATTSDAMLIYRLLQQYLPSLAEMAVVMYPDVVAGELAPYIDSSLGAIAVRKGRA